MLSPDRLRRRADRERRARLEAETIAERATGDLHGALAELRAAEARARIVTETAARLLEGTLDMTATLEAVADAARRALGASRATFFICAEDRDRIETMVSTETDPEVLRTLSWAVGRPRGDLPLWDHLRGAIVSIPDIAAAGALAEPVRARLSSRAIAGVRMEHVSLTRDDSSEVLGAFFVGWSEPRDITRHDELVVRSLAGMAKLAVANARLTSATLASLAEAQERAALDPLTGLANHRTFHDRLSEEAARAARHGRALSLVLFDLDRFKAVNDLHGHQAGDDVLVAAARVLEGQAREGDLVARVGGEEFAWLMPESDGLDAWQAAERAREAIAATAFPPVGAMTVSAGRLRPGPGRRRGPPLPAGRRRALLEQAPRPRRRLPLLAGRRAGALGRGAGHAPAPPAGAPEHPDARARGGRQGLLHPPALRARRRPRRPDRGASSAGARSAPSACTRRASCTMSASSPSRTRCC